MRLTIERMRTLVLVAGGLLLLALIAFLAIGKWKNPFNKRDIPHHLGIDIQQEANGFTYTQSHGGHTLFKLHASKVVQLKDNHALLHDVKIELYGADGSRVDRIEGKEFEYDQKAGTAKADGPVEITLMRPGVAPAIAPKASASHAATDKNLSKPLEAAAQTAAAGEIHVKTSGLIFDQKSGTATTSDRVDFTLAQGSGTSIGATYDSEKGVLVLDRAVELSTRRGVDLVQLHAQHAEFQRDEQICQLHAATVDTRDNQATAGDATILFREDGSAQHLDAVHGFTLATATGSHLAAPQGQMDFDERNQPSHGHLQGGVTIDSASHQGNLSRSTHGSAPTAELEFAQGQLHHAHLERGVELLSEEQSTDAKNGPLSTKRSWRSPLADVEFRTTAQGEMQPETIHGMDGVVVTGTSQRGNQPASPSRFAADDVTGRFGTDAALSALIGVGHASVDQTTLTGVRQTTSGDRLEAHFATEAKPGIKEKKDESDAAMQIQSATIDGHVVLTRQAAPRPGAQPEAPLRATAGHAVYEGEGDWLHLTQSPRVEDGGLQLTADKIDVAQSTGDAFAHGNVKATWDSSAGQPAAPGGQGPSHVVSAEAQLHQATGEATFRGQARLWQQANSISAPTIVLDRTRQTLTAHSASAAEPVKAVMLSASGAGNLLSPDAAHGKDTGNKPPAVVRLRGGDLRYSNLERKALMRSGVLGTVTAETDSATSTSNEVEVILQPQNKGKDNNQVDRLIARGRVAVSSEGRRGTGEQLVYTSATGEYVMTGTASTPPRMTDPQRGAVSGEALIFRSRNDSITVEGGRGKTTTETNAPR